MLNRPSNRTRTEIQALAKRAIETHGGGDVARVWYKFDCRLCGERCKIQTPNVLPERGTCDVCGTVTQILGAGYALEWRRSRFVPWESDAIVIRPKYAADRGDA